MLLLQQTASASILGVHVAASRTQQRLVPTIGLEIARSRFRPFLFATHNVILEEDIVALLTQTGACVPLFVARNSVLFRQCAAVILLWRFYTFLFFNLRFSSGARTGLLLRFSLGSTGCLLDQLLHQFVVGIVVDLLLLRIFAEPTLRRLHDVGEEAVGLLGRLLASTQVICLSFQTLMALLI